MPGYDPDVYISETTPSIQLQQRQRVDAVLNEYVAGNAVSEVQKEMDLMTEARTRFAKAALYEQMITGQLFEGDDPVTLEVENEFKEFAEERLMVLLGMQAEKLHKNLATFDAEQVEALKMLADKILKRQLTLQASPLTKPLPPPPTVQLAPPKRGRGRPPGANKKTTPPPVSFQRTQFTRPPAITPTSIAPSPVMDPPANTNQEKKTITLPNGQIKEVSVSKGQVKGSAVLPMPSPDEMVALAQAHGEAAYRNQGALMSAKAELAEATIPRVVVNV